jgi:transcription-repair coupling factor (superfamily II helicase)
MRPLSSILRGLPALTEALTRPSGVTPLVAPAAIHIPLVAAAVTADDAPPVVLVVTPSSREADQVRDTLRTLIDPAIHVWDLPAWETLPHERLSPHPETVARRLSVVRALQQPTGSHPLVVVASVRSLIQPVNTELAHVQWATLRRGEQGQSLDELTATLVSLAYQRVDLVTRRGEFAVRGGIVDVFPALSDHPVRADFFGDEIDDLNAFSVADQRSLEPVDEVDIPPARELLLTDSVRSHASQLVHEYPGVQGMLEKIAQGIPVEGMESLQTVLVDQMGPITDFFPRETMIVELQPERVRTRARSLIDTNREFLEAAWETAAAGNTERPIDFHTGEFYSPEQLIEHAGERRWVSCAALDSGAESNRHIPASAVELEHSGGEHALDFVRQKRQDGHTVVICAQGHGLVQRAIDVLAEVDIPAVEVDSDSSEFRPDVVNIVQAGLTDGFSVDDHALTVIGERDFFGRASTASPRAQKTLAAKRRGGVNPLELTPGDFVVHDTHGIGRFVEVVRREVSTGGRDAKKSEREFVVLEYAPSKRGGANDKLFVPTDQLDLLSLYVGGESPALSKMGGQEWSAAKSKARKAVRDIAVDLVKLYSARMSQPGFAFSPDTELQRELEDAFAFVETPDQLSTIDEVKADMERPIPMDRLIAGDVGFGKTEVAVRAAFKAVQDNKQVAVLAPTTLLVRQHLETFQERYAPFPLRLASLSRFSTAAEAKKVIQGLAEGTIDVVIGTHRLLSDQVKFADLGLIVVDEEQRFGVEHKDKLKKIRANVDVLSMSATPIPRTLEMAVTGIREMSTLQTPPENRHPILTFVGERSDQQIVAAIRRELLREGQVFYVSNRVQGIQQVANNVAELVPEARVAVAHGQMGEGELERVMVEFWEGHYDVLVSTTIIETGLDVTNANTLIVERAERFGLAQLHQLRGRVGRGRERAYSYFLFDPEANLSDDAHERLSTLAAHSDLGGGMQIAMKDLELRGAGNLLGAEQAGHIAGVGFDLYLRMMAEAIGTFRGDVNPEQTELRLELPIDARIPEDYIDSDRLRLEAYQKLSHAAGPNVEETVVDDVIAELDDRYGSLPLPVQTLVLVTRLRRKAQAAGLSEVLVMGSKLRVVGPPLPDSLQVRLQRMYPKGNYLAPARVVLIPLPDDHSDHALVAWVDGVIEALYPKAASSETLNS